MSLEGVEEETMEFNQEELLKRIGKRKPEKGIHSFLHELVKEASEYVGEPKNFGFWLGRAKAIGQAEFKNKLDYVKSKSIREAKYLAACTRRSV